MRSGAGLLAAPHIRIGRVDIAGSERETVTIRDAEPLVAIGEVLDDRPDGVAQRDVLAGVAEVTAVLSDNRQARAIAGLEHRPVPHDQTSPLRREFEIGKREVDSLRESDQIQIDRSRADVRQLHVLAIRGSFGSSVSGGWYMISLMRRLSATGPTANTVSLRALSVLPLCARAWIRTLLVSGIGAV